MQGCPAGTWSTSVGVSRLADCDNNDCLGAAYYCPAGATQPLAVANGNYSIPEGASPTARTGQAACDESFESCNDLGLYARVLFALDAAGYASVRGSAIRGRHLRASVRNSRRVCVAEMKAR